MEPIICARCGAEITAGIPVVVYGPDIMHRFPCLCDEDGAKAIEELERIADMEDDREKDGR